MSIGFLGLRLSAPRWFKRTCGIGLGILLCLVLGTVSHQGNAVSSIQTLPETELTVSTATQSLDGTWQFLPAPTASTELRPSSPLLPSLDWSQSQAIAVPANWYTAGYDIAGVAWYRYTFAVDTALQTQDLSLIFNGVDYAADVWLNDQYLGFHEGYFQRFGFPITAAIAFDRENELIVRVNSPLESAPQDWSLHKRLIKGVLSHHDARPGGAWSDRGQEKNTGGIWDSVMLRGSQALAIEQLRVTPKLNRTFTNAIAQVQVDLTRYESRSLPVQVKAQLLPVNFQADQGAVYGIEQTLEPDTTALTIAVPQAHPRLWWTWDHGRPNLYELRLQIWSGDRLLDAAVTQFGFRTVERDATHHWFRLNGHRIFLKGTNYIPDQWLSQLTGDRLRQDIQLMQAAHINAVRVHAHVTSPEFYHLANAAGLLIWQDFPLQWGYEDTPAFTQEAIRQAHEMIGQLYNHPAIFAWSLHNEPPWNATWMVDMYENYDPKQNRQFGQTLYEAVMPADATRYLHAASVLAEHPWWGWYSSTYERYGQPTEEPLITEFGAQALPNVASLRRIFNPAQLWPEEEADWSEWQYHNFQRYETFELAKVDPGQTLEEFVDNTQNYQARLHQYAAEAYRRQKYEPVSAIFQFMFCEPWPSISWGMVDYWRQPKAGYAALQMAYQPILPSILAPAEPQTVGTAIPIEVWGINDTWNELTGTTLQFSIHRGDRLLRETSLLFELAADGLKPLEQIQFVPEQAGDYILTATIYDEQRQALGINHYALKIVTAQSS